MAVHIVQETLTSLTEYGGIPISFGVEEIFDVAEDPANGLLTLTPRLLASSYVKDYDAVDGERPSDWPNRFDMSAWGVLGAFANGERVAGAVIAYDTPALDMLEGRSDLAVLWDIRVLPSARRRGVGSALFDAAMAWGAARGCRELKIETQNINVAACRFYARQQCVLKGATRSAYARFPAEIQLLWYKTIP